MLFSSSAMKVLSWNFRGINAPDKRAYIKHQIDDYGADIALLQETKLYGESYEAIIQKWVKWTSSQSLAQGDFGGTCNTMEPQISPG